jgi:hypothetical protein
MGTVEEIETAIQMLSVNDIARLDQWWAEYHARLWDEQMKADAGDGGCLRPMIEEAKADYRAGRTHPLP